MLDIKNVVVEKIEIRMSDKHYEEFKHIMGA